MPPDIVQREFEISILSRGGHQEILFSSGMSRPKKTVAATSLAVLVHVATAFQSNMQFLHSHQQAIRNKQSTQRYVSFIPSFLSSELETELWLDLRQTAIHPKAAMDRLESQLGTESFVDRIILSEDVFQNLVDYSDLYLSASRILYHDTTNDDIFFATGRGLSFPFGRFQLPPLDATVVVDDPIPAMEVIASGKWLFLGNRVENGRDDSDRETLRMGAVGTFLDIANTASGCSLWSLSSKNSSGLVLPTARNEGMSIDRADTDDAGRGGGVAVSCNTKSSVMKLASMLQLARPGDTTIMTDSGIIVQSSNHSSNYISTAAVLPFETDIWQIALLVFGAP